MRGSGEVIPVVSNPPSEVCNDAQAYPIAPALRTRRLTATEGSEVRLNPHAVATAESRIISQMLLTLCPLA
jgi:hypothetical protein